MNVNSSEMENTCLEDGFLNPNSICLDQATSNSQTPTGCPTIQLNYDTIYPEAATDPANKGLSPTRLFPLPSSDARHRPTLPTVLLTYAPPTQDADHKYRLSPVLLTN